MFETKVRPYNKRVASDKLVTVHHPESLEDLKDLLKRENNVSVVCGNRSFVNAGLRGGCVVSLSEMASVDIVAADVGDSKGGLGYVTILEVAGDINVGQVVEILDAYGVYLPTAVAGDVGMIGSTLGGGYGLLSRQFGLTSDFVLSMERFEQSDIVLKIKYVCLPQLKHVWIQERSCGYKDFETSLVELSMVDELTSYSVVMGRRAMCLKLYSLDEKLGAEWREVAFGDFVRDIDRTRRDGDDYENFWFVTRSRIMRISRFISSRIFEPIIEVLNEADSYCILSSFPSKPTTCASFTTNEHMIMFQLVVADERAVSDGVLHTLDKAIKVLESSDGQVFRYPNYAEE